MNKLNVVVFSFSGVSLAAVIAQLWCCLLQTVHHGGHSLCISHHDQGLTLCRFSSSSRIRAAALSVSSTADFVFSFLPAIHKSDRNTMAAQRRTTTNYIGTLLSVKLQFDSPNCERIPPSSSHTRSPAAPVRLLSEVLRTPYSAPTQFQACMCASSTGILPQ